MLQRFLLLWLTLLSLMAYFWPQWFSQEWDPFVLTKPGIPYLFAVTMFAIGALLPRDEIRQVIRRWPTVLGGTAVQYIAMPLLAYLFGHALGIQDQLLLGVILVGCVPGAMASNVLTLAARGNVSYSVSLTTSATLFSPLVVPLALYLTLQQTDVDRVLLMKKAFWILITQVVGPVVTGHLLSRRFPRFEDRMRRIGPVIANLTILWIVAVVVNANHTNIGHARADLIAALLAINFCGYLSGSGGGALLKLDGGMRRALTLEIGMQNAGLGVTLAQQLFPNEPLVGLPPALYTFGCMLTGTVLASIWSMRTARASRWEQDQD